MTGRALELKADKTTIGRVEDNTYQIAEASVSSHHCEVLLRGSEVVIKDLNSTNGTFINGEKIAESVLKPGQTLRLGQVELQIETEGSPFTAPVPAPGAPAEAPAMPAKKLDKTMVMQRGVSLDELEQGPRTTGFDTASKAFSKKSNQTNRLFLIGGIITAAVVVLVFVIIFLTVKK